MGGKPWYIVTTFDHDLPSSLRRAQQETLASGEFEVTTPARGNGTPKTIEEAREAGGDDGTASVLDVLELGDAPGFSVAGPFADDHLEEMFGTAKPTRGVVMAKLDEVLEYIDRGEAAYVILYEEDQPTQVLFAGCSVD